MTHQLGDTCRKYKDRRPIIRISEGGKEIHFINESGKEVSEYRVDDCILKSSDGKKCDFLFLVTEDKKAFFIELKGKNVGEALQQIDTSIARLKERLTNYQLFARVISSRVPAVETGKERTLKKKLLSSRIDVKVKNKKWEEYI